MRLFNRFRKQEIPTPPEAVAAELYAYSRIDLEEEILPEKDHKCRPSVNANFKFTKAAIIIQWLRILEQNPSSSIRARAVLGEFERLTFSTFQPEERSWLVDHIRKLVTLTNAINAFMEDKSMSKDEVGSKGFEIAESWFKLVLDDQNLVARACIMHGAALILLLHDEMREIAEMAGNAVFGGEKPNDPAESN